MQTIILPGYSEHNKGWTDEVAKNLKIDGIIRPFHWAHWTDENNKFDANEKANLIAKHLRGDNVNIIAKSLGTLVASYLYLLIPNQIEKIIFCGIPLTSLNEDDLGVIKSCIGKSNDKFLGFQNVSDPHGSFQEVKDFGNFLMRSRDDHEYPYFDEFNNFLK